VVEMKRRNPRFGCRKIAEQISDAFGIELNKDVGRRIRIRYYGPISGGDGPSWLTFIGHAKDSLWSIDLFRCESIVLKSYWIMVVLDVFTRRIIGFGVTPAELDGPAVCICTSSEPIGQVGIGIKRGTGPSGLKFWLQDSAAGVDLRWFSV
jgi:putative transposase